MGELGSHLGFALGSWQLTSPLCVWVAPPERALIVMGFAGASGKQDHAPAKLQFEQWCQGFDHQLLLSRVAAKGLAEQTDCSVLLDLNRCLERQVESRDTALQATTKEWPYEHASWKGISSFPRRRGGSAVLSLHWQQLDLVLEHQWKSFQMSVKNVSSSV